MVGSNPTLNKLGSDYNQLEPFFAVHSELQINFTKVFSQNKLIVTNQNPVSFMLHYLINLSYNKGANAYLPKVSLLKEIK